MDPQYWLVLLPLVGVYAQTMDIGPPPASETEVSTALSEQSPSPTTVNTNNGNAGTSTVLVVADGTTSTVQSDTTMIVIVGTFAPGSPASPGSTTYVASEMSTTTPSISDDGTTSAAPSDVVPSETSDAPTTDAGTSVTTTPAETPSGASDTPTTLETVPSPTTVVAAQTTTQTDSVPTSPVPTAAAPPITSCNLATFPASTGASATTKDSSLYCSCNDEQQANVGSMTDADGYTTFTCDLGSSTTLAVTTQPPAITSCSLSTQPATVISGQSFSQTEMCDCNGFWQAGLSTTVGPDKTTSWICAVEATATDATPIVVKTQDPAPERTPYLPGICNLHVLQAFKEGGDTSWLSLDIQDPDGAELASNKVSEVKWDDTYTLDEDDTGLPWPLGVTPVKAVWPEGQIKPEDVVTQQEVPLTIHTGEVQFQSDDPQACSVSEWMWDDATGDVSKTFGVDEAMLNRQMQCTFAC